MALLYGIGICSGLRLIGLTGWERRALGAAKCWRKFCCGTGSTAPTSLGCLANASPEPISPSEFPAARFVVPEVCAGGAAAGPDEEAAAAVGAGVVFCCGNTAASSISPSMRTTNILRMFWSM